MTFTIQGGARVLVQNSLSGSEFVNGSNSLNKLRSVKISSLNGKCCKASRLSALQAMKSAEGARNATVSVQNDTNGSVGVSEKVPRRVSTVGNSTNILWHESSVVKLDRQELLQQKGCVIWMTGLSGSGKSTVACALARGLHSKGKMTYTLDGDNVRHGLNRDLSFKAEDRAENIRRVGEVAKLFADAGVICIASLISPYRRDRDACRAILPEGDFVEVFMDTPIQLCESRDPKGLYKLAHAGKIKGFTGVDDPYEPPENAEVCLLVLENTISETSKPGQKQRYTDETYA